MASTLPNVLVVGGLTSVSRQFAQSLFPENGPPLCARLRIIDKYTIDPPSTYVGSTFPEFVKRPEVEYKQNNLTLPERMKDVFDAPDNGRPWTYVFDFLGEVNYEAGERTQVLQTYKASVNCGLEAARLGNVRAYVRLTFGFYNFEPVLKVHTEAEQLEPEGERGVWWHETLRSLAAIPNLPLVILRAAMPYGPHCSYGLITRRILIGEVYRYKEKPMNYLWSPNLRLNTVHTDDIAGACWAAAEWIARIGRAEADKQAGVALWFANDWDRVQALQLQGVVANTVTPTAPMFNVVDDSDSTQETVGKVIAQYYNVTLEFTPDIESYIDRRGWDTVVGEINEYHAMVWYQLCAKNEPPLDFVLLDTYAEGHDLTYHSTALDGTRLKEVLGYHLRRPTFEVAAIDEIVTGWKEEKEFPVVEGTDPDEEQLVDDDDDEDDED